MASPVIYPHWKQHSIGNFYQLDEDVDIDKFCKETNFSGGAFYDPVTKIVKYYATDEHGLELIRYKATETLESLWFDYIDEDCLYCTSVFFDIDDSKE